MQVLLYFWYFFVVMSCLGGSQIKVTVASVRSIPGWRQLAILRYLCHTLCADVRFWDFFAISQKVLPCGLGLWQ
jgi:hypothetical protein